MWEFKEIVRWIIMILIILIGTIIAESISNDMRTAYFIGGIVGILSVSVHLNV